MNARKLAAALRLAAEALDEQDGAVPEVPAEKRSRRRAVREPYRPSTPSTPEAIETAQRLLTRAGVYRT